jgi:YD repeat-containing protein
VVTTLTYDERRRLRFQDRGGELTEYRYQPTGLLEQIVAPDGSTLTYTYDAAHRLTDIQDSLGNLLHYELDAMGNWETEQTKNASGTLVRTRTREYNPLNRLERELGAVNPLDITEYQCDDNGNLRFVTLPKPTASALERKIEQQWDALNRLRSVIDPSPDGVNPGGQTQFGHDGLDRLVSVIDPRGVPTSYSLTGLGNLGASVSRDAGTSTTPLDDTGFDRAGNRLQVTDGRDKTTSYTYDALNRLTTMSFEDGTSIAYGYDAGTNGKGRLTGIAFPGGSTRYTYDPQGRVREKRDTHHPGGAAGGELRLPRGRRPAHKDHLPLRPPARPGLRPQRAGEQPEPGGERDRQPDRLLPVRAAQAVDLGFGGYRESRLRPRRAVDLVPAHRHRLQRPPGGLRRGFAHREDLEPLLARDQHPDHGLRRARPAHRLGERQQ